MQLLDLSQELFCNGSNLLLAKGTLDIGEHVEVSSTLAQEFGTCVVQTTFALVNVCVQDHRRLQFLQVIQLLLEALVLQEVGLWHDESLD